MSSLGDPATGATLLSAVCAGAAGWLLVRPSADRRVPRRLDRWDPRQSRPMARAHKLVAATGGAVLAGGLASWVLTGASGSAGGVVAVALPLGLTATVMAAAASWLARRARSLTATRRMRADVVEACEAIASGLRAGLPPERVLARTAEDIPVLLPAATAARLGAEVAPALRSVANRAGAERLAMLAAAWDVARRSGAGLADVVSRIAAMVRADSGRQRQVDAALGGARSTARLFAVLPLLGVGLGAGMDADPVHVLTATPVGAWCLCAGTTLAVTGLVWVERLAHRAAR